LSELRNIAARPPGGGTTASVPEAVTYRRGGRCLSRCRTIRRVAAGSTRWVLPGRR